MAESIRLTVEKQAAVAHSIDVELRHQNSRYFSSDRPFVST
jgi:hypothetical protein